MVQTIRAGLEDVVAGTSAISSIVGNVLTYRGYPIETLANHSSFEEVVYLLWYGTLPSRRQVDQLKQQLAENCALPQPVYEEVQRLPQAASPMAMLRSGVSLLGIYDPDGDDISADANWRRAVRLTGCMSTLLTTFQNLRSGKEPRAPRPELSIAANFLYMLNGQDAGPLEVRAFDKALVLHADHEFNASTFAARQTASTLSDMYSAVTSAVGTLKGPLHGGANQEVMRMLGQIGSLENVESWVREALAAKKRIPGFGHRVYKDGDPRAKHLRLMSMELSRQKGNVNNHLMLEKIEAVMLEQPKALKPNVDFYSGSVYTLLGLPMDLFTPVFACARVAGWTAHIMEQYGNNRLIRPRADYTGPTNQTYVPLDKRV